ncbi:AraC family transcriptional regulator [Specibacter cremeus]|uniref:AraC family transcriptional regulator n=1 Tax=Specibacter cremeus TaxID=1629051 RepID=UPI000F794177|nr:AraC family transcriptional regulator [Specibacter cremeus]
MDLRDVVLRHRDGTVLDGPDSVRTIDVLGRIVPANDGDFAARMRMWAWDQLVVAVASGDGSTVYREDSHLGDAFDKYVLVVLVHAGTLTYTQRGHTGTVGPGHVVTYLPRETFEFRAVDGGEGTLLHVPIDYVESRGVDADALAGAGWHGGPLVAGIRELVKGTGEIPGDGAAIPAAAVENAILELVVAILLQHQGASGRRDSATDEHRLRVLELIDARFRDPYFGVSELAADLGVSRRYVYKLFEGRPVSVAAMLRTRRLGHAKLLLRQPRSDATLSRVAKESGFASADAFGRVFRTRLGLSPSEYRAEFQAGTPDGHGRAGAPED